MNKRLRIKIVIITVSVVFMGIILNLKVWGKDLVVSAAASLKPVMTEIGGAYEKKYPDMHVVFNFAGSGTLVQQIIQGAPVDVFASADQLSMEQASKQGLIVKESRRDFVGNALVLAVPVNSSLLVHGLRDLTRREIHTVAIGNPAVCPAGRYAKQALKTASLWDKLAEKYVYADSVSQILDYLKREEVDAGVLYASDAAWASRSIRVVDVLMGHDAIVYPIAIITSSREMQRARDFIQFVCSDEMSRVFTKDGFIPLKGSKK